VTQIKTYTTWVKRMVSRVLTGNGMTNYGDGLYTLIDAEELSDSVHDALLQLCRQRLDGFSEQRGEEVFASRRAPCWNDASTGLPPLDAAIERVNSLGYNHHIERLMVISNLMLLCEIHPGEVHRWFMERYLDSYEWVMGPNVYGMGLMSDGGLFATKPYIGGSNYLLKMGDFKKGPWCEIWDGLYWRFIDRHLDFFQANPSLSMMVRLLERMEPGRRQALELAAGAVLEREVLIRLQHHGELPQYALRQQPGLQFGQRLAQAHPVGRNPHPRKGDRLPGAAEEAPTSGVSRITSFTTASSRGARTASLIPARTEAED